MTLSELILWHENQRILSTEGMPKHQFHNDAVLFLKHQSELYKILHNYHHLVSIWVENARKIEGTPNEH